MGWVLCAELLGCSRGPGGRDWLDEVRVLTSSQGWINEIELGGKAGGSGSGLNGGR